MKILIIPVIVVLISFTLLIKSELKAESPDNIKFNKYYDKELNVVCYHNHIASSNFSLSCVRF